MRPIVVFPLLIAAVCVAGCVSESPPDEAPAPAPAPPQADPGPPPAAPPPPPDPGEHPSIGVALPDLADPFFEALADALTEEAAAHGFAVHVADAAQDAERQLEQVRGFLGEGVSAVVLAPVAAVAAGAALAAADRAGTPVFTTVTAPDGDPDTVVAHVAADDYGGGRLAAQALVEAVGGRGRVAIIDHPFTDAIVARTRGFMDEIDAQNQHPDVSVRVVGQVLGGGAHDPSYRAAGDLMAAEPDLAGLFAVNDVSALGARAAVEAAGRGDAVAVVGFGGTPAGRQAILEGRLLAGAAADAADIGRETARTVLRYFEGAPVDRKVLVPVRLLTQADALNGGAPAGPGA